MNNSPAVVTQYIDSQGPISGWLLFTWVSGSSTIPKYLYADPECTIPLMNPLQADSNGVLPEHFLESGEYRFDARRSLDGTLTPGAVLWTRDYVSATGSGGTAEDDHKVMVSASDPSPNYLIDKLVAGDNVDIEAEYDGEQTVLISGQGKLKTKSTDSVFQYLEEALVDSPTAVFTSTTTAGDTKISVNVDTQYGNVIPVWTILKTSDPATAPFGLSDSDRYQMWSRHYGAAASEAQTTDPAPVPSDLSVWFVEGETFETAVWVEKHHKVGTMILNANKGLYDYMLEFPEFPTTQDYSNYPAGLYSLGRDSADGYIWRMQVVKQYPDPEYASDSVLTYNATTHVFEWELKEFISPGTVRVKVDDPAYNYLNYKVQAGEGIEIDIVPNGVYGDYLSVRATGSNPSGGHYASTMYVANAIHTLAPNLIVRSELICLFVPTTDFKVTLASLFGCFLSQTGTGQLRFTLRDDQYRLIANSTTVSNPAPSVFLELQCANIQNPITAAPLTEYLLDAGGRYYLGINWNANGIQLLGDDAVQNTNIQPYPAYKVDNLSSVPQQLTGGGESKQRVFVRLKG